MSFKDFFYSDKYWLLRHILFWLFIFLDEILALIGLSEEMEFDIYSLLIIIDVLLVYFNLYYLIPKYFNQNKFSQYIIWTIFTLLLNTALTNLIPFEPMPTRELVTILIISTFITAGMLSMAVAIKISKINFLRLQELNELQSINHEVEKSILKKQVNPHFMFNVLNNIYVQSKEEPAKAPDSILQLSDLMRYQTYEAGKKTVQLKKEIEFLRQYVDFELMRRTNLNVDIVVVGNIGMVGIPPMLYLPMIENACKHSSQVNSEKEWIKMKWEYKNNQLSFDIENSIGVRSGLINDDEYSGFGLDNLKKRLQLLFPDKHNFTILENDNTYKINLNIRYG